MHVSEITPVLDLTTSDVQMIKIDKIANKEKKTSKQKIKMLII